MSQKINSILKILIFTYCPKISLNFNNNDSDDNLFFIIDKNFKASEFSNFFL